MTRAVHGSLVGWLISLLLVGAATSPLGAAAPPPVEVARAHFTVASDGAGVLEVGAGGRSDRTPVAWAGEGHLRLVVDPGAGRIEASLLGTDPASAALDGVGGSLSIPVSLLELRLSVAAQPPPPAGESKEAAAAREIETPRLRVTGIHLRATGSERDLEDVVVEAGRSVAITEFVPEMGSGPELLVSFSASGEPAPFGVEARLLAASRVAVAKEGEPSVGVVRSVDGTLLCGPDCKQAVAFVAPGARLELVAEAAPEADGSLGEWSGDCDPVAADRATLVAPELPDSAACSVRFSGEALPTVPPKGRFGFYANPTTITVPNLGPGSPYPSTILVEQAGGAIDRVEVGLNLVAHSYPDDLDILVESPAASSVILMSDACGPDDPGGRNWLFADDWPTPMPDAGPCDGIGYRPTDYEVGESWPPPAPAPPHASQLTDLRGQNPNGTWSLYVNDDAGGDAGSIGNGWSITLNIDPAEVVIPVTGTWGNADPYPSVVLYQTTPLGPIADLNLVLPCAYHSFPDDVDLLLVSPAGTAVVVMSDACGDDDVAGFVWRFDDQAAAPMPDEEPCLAVEHQPTNYELGDDWPPPAPAGPHGSTMSAFTDENPFGEWQLYAVDDSASDAGFLLDGWDLEVTTGPVMVAVPASGTAGAATPYPFELSWSGANGRVVSLEFGLVGLAHTYPDDLEVLLESPEGTAVLLMADACGGAGFHARDLHFSDAAPTALPDGGPCPSGTYRPSAHDVVSFPPPAPQGFYATTLGAFFGDNPEGIWKLWVNDDAGGDAGYSWFYVAALVLSTDLLFADGFEEGDTSDWSGTAP
jgi:subtilisin-like proprotein convertase family protein